jgi:hypothetical protein
MLSKHCIARFSLCLILLGLVAAVPALAGSAVVGSVAGSMNATVGGQTLLPNTTLFSGDSLQVKDGVAVVALGSASRVVFGRDTVASFLRDSNEVTVLLSQGNLAVFHDVDGTPVRMKIGDISVAPVSGFKTLGEVATLNGAVVVTAKEGMLHVEGNGQVVDVAKGKTITLVPTNQQGGKTPAGGAGRCCAGGTSTALAAGALAAAGGAIIVGAVAASRAGTASSNASSAEAAAAAAESNAAAAGASASAAVSAANAAASAALYNSISLGCALNTLANSLGKASPYTPPAGVSCYNTGTW